MSVGRFTLVQNKRWVIQFDSYGELLDYYSQSLRNNPEAWPIQIIYEDSSKHIRRDYYRWNHSINSSEAIDQNEFERIYREREFNEDLTKIIT